jgi:hypothetical protein
MTAALDDPTAVYERDGEELSAAEHVEKMIAAGEIPESDRDRPVSEVFSDYADRNGLLADDDQVPQAVNGPGSTFDQAEDRWLDANQEINVATAKYLETRRAYGEASAKAGEAADAYEATPRGLAEATERYDSVDGSEHPVQAHVLGQRLERATERMNMESALRTRKWGGGRVSYEPVHRTRATLEGHKAPFAQMAQQDGVRASAENHGYYMDGRTGS